MFESEILTSSFMLESEILKLF